MPLKLTAPPTSEPFVAATDASLRQHLRLDAGDTSQDSLIGLYIAHARETAEHQCRRAFITQSWLVTLDRFPAPGLETSSANWYGPAWGVGPGPLTTVKPDGRTQFEITIPLPPLQTIDSIRYYDPVGLLQTLDPSLYLVDNISEPARVTPAPGAVWPSTQNRANAVEVQFTTGYGDLGESIPRGIRAWMLMRIGDLYENREAVVMGVRGTVGTHPFIDRLLDPYRVLVY
jgi:hypothetical protein